MSIQYRIERLMYKIISCLYHTRYIDYEYEIKKELIDMLIDLPHQWNSEFHKGKWAKEGAREARLTEKEVKLNEFVRKWNLDEGN